MPQLHFSSPLLVTILLCALALCGYCHGEYRAQSWLLLELIIPFFDGAVLALFPKARLRLPKVPIGAPVLAPDV